jgi:hypothetical protein
MDETLPQAEPASTNSVPKHESKLWLYGAVSIFLIGAAVYGGSVYLNKREARMLAESRSVAESVRSGDYEAALAQYNALKDVDGEVGARAVRNVYEGLFEATGGDIEAVLQGVRELKETIADTSITPESRAMSISVLAHAYNESGENQRVFDEIYSGDPYASLRVEGSAARSMRNLLEWSYEVYPTPVVANSIATTYAKNLLNRPYVSASRRAEIDADDTIGKARYYMQESDRLLAAAVAANPGYEATSRYVTQRYWRVFTEASIAYAEGGKDKEGYKKSYADLITYLRGHNEEAREYLPYAHWSYAMFLMLIDNDNEAAKGELNNAVGAVTIDPEPETNEFLTFLRNEKTRPPTNFSTASIAKMAELSPEFKAMLESL